MMRATASRNLAEAATLLAAGGVSDSELSESLWHTAMRGHTEVAAWLLANGAPLDGLLPRCVNSTHAYVRGFAVGH